MNAKIKKFGFPLPIAGAFGGSKSPSVPREDPDNLQSSAYVNIIDLIGEGQIGGLVDNVDGDSLTEKEKSIFFDGTRLRHTNGELNFANVSWAERVGLQRQDYIEGFGEGVETPFYKNVQLKSGIPSAFTVSNPNADRVRIILAVNSLLSTDRTSGDTYGTSVEFQIKLSVNNGPYEILANKKITGKTTSRYQRSFSFDLPKKKADGTPITAWSFQITRTTPDSNSSYLQNTTFFESYSEVELTKFSYPNVALVATRFSSETFSSIPKREYLVDGLLIKVPSNRNKDGSYTGPWDGTFKLESSSNPAWILYDLLLSKRYGLGEYITPEMIDESRLYVIGQYCDQLVDDGFGNKEPRYTINCVINTRVEAYDLIVDICSAFNGMAYWAGHMVGFTIDAPGTPQMLFNNTNIVGDFSYQGTSNKDRHSVAVVTWNDPNDDYKQVPEVVEDPELIERYGIRKTEVMAFGCTSRGQAARYGRWLLYSEHQQSETITFNVGIDAALLLPGDLIYVQDRDRAGKRFGGRLLDCTAKQAVLDDLVDFGEFTDLTLVIRLEDGSLAEREIASHTKKTVTVSGHTKEVTVVEWAEALTVMPVKYALWIIKAAELQPVIARVVNVAQGEEKGTYNITAVPHNPNKYQSIENDLMLDVPPTSILNSRNQEPPASVEIKSEIITTQNVAKTRLVISWKEAKNAARYEVEWKRNDGNWVKLPQTTSLSIEVEDVYAGAYTARVVAYNLFGARSYPKYSTSTDVKGKVGKPTNVLSLTTTPLLFGMKLDWVYPAGNSDLSHVVIEVSDRADGSNPRLLGNVSYPTNTLTIQGLQGGLDQWYRTKTVDKSGNESDWSTFVKGTTGNDPDLVLDLISGQIEESDLAQELQGKIENSANVAEAAQTAATDAQTAAVNAQTSANEAASVASKTASDLQSVTDQLNKEISDEANARIAAIAQLNDGLTTETTQRKSEDAALLSNIETYKSSTNGTLSSLQEQITTNATNTSANASKISSLDSRLTTNEGKTADAINSAATAQQTASTAVEKANAAANSVTSLKSELSTGKGVNNIIAPFSDPQELSPYLTGANRTVALVKSPMRINGKAYDVTFNAVAGNIYFGSSSNATVNTTAAGTITGGKRYMFSAYLKNLDATKQAEVNFMIYWFRRTSGGISITQALLVNQTTNITRITPSNDGGTISFKSVTAPSDAFAFIFLCYGNGVYNVAGSRILIDMLMLEEVVGVDVPASTWTAGPADLSAIKSALDANASAISNLKTRVTNAEGVITSQGDSITQLNNSVTSINGELTKKAESSALQALDSKVSNIGGQVTTNTNSITSLNSRVTNAEGDISIANGAINSLSTRISDAEGKLTSQSEAVTQLSDQIGNTKSYSILTFRNGSAIGMPKDGGIHSFKGKINGFGRGLNLIVFNNGDVVSCNNYDTYGYMESACQDLNNAIQGLNSGTYFAIVGTDNIGSVAVHGAAENLRATLLACGASRSYLNTWVGNSLPIFIGRKDLDAGNGILGMFDSTVSNQWIEYPLTFVSGVPMGIGDARAITTLLDANASAISSLSNTVTQQGNDLISHSNSLTSLSNSLVLSGKAGTNLLIKSNVVGTYNGMGYPHVTYEMGEEWEIGAKYTLLWCAEHKRGAGDTNSSLWAYAGGGWQGLQGIENTNGKIVNKVTFTKDGGPDGKYINFYMINPPTADKNSIGTVYWAVLVKGDLITTDAWVPSAYDYLPDTKANSTALNSLDSKVTNIDGRVSSNSSAITSLNSRIATAEGNITSNANAIANTYTKAQADEAMAGQINSFNSSLVIGGRNLVRNTQTVREGWNWLFIEPFVEPLVGQYTISFDIENLDGTFTSSGVGFRNPNGDYKYFWWPDSSSGHKVATINIDSTGFESFGLYFNSRVRLKNVKVEKGSKETGWSPAPEDIKAGIDANASALSSLSSRVTTTEGNIASQSSSITSLTNQIGNTKSYSIVTFRNGSAVGMPKDGGIHSYKGKISGFGRGLNLIVFNNGDVVSCTAYDTYGDIVAGCNAIYAAINALASGTYFAIVGTDNIGAVGDSNPNTDLRALLLACGAGDRYFRSWNWNALPIFIGRKDLDAGNGILGMFDSTVGNQWIEYPLTFVNGAPMGMGDARNVTAQLDANAAAISSLSNTVAQQGNDIVSHSNALTSLSASVSGIYKEIQLSDTRNDNQPPAWYWQNHGLKIVREFKTTAVLGLSGIMPDSYVTLETQVPWIDPSGGPIIQIARGSSSAFTAERRSADYNSWFAWSQDIKALSDGLSNKAEASALSSLDAKVSTIDGKVSTQATSITNLQTTVGGHTASIQSQQQSIDGLKSRATLKLQSGNLIGGVGIENDSKTVDFIIQANKFAIAPPSNAAAGSVAPKYAFVYQPTATTLPNGTVVPAGLYLDNASIGYINAEKINASSLSALSATLGTLVTYKDPSKPNGARMVITGSLITVYDDNNVLRVKLGLWN
ncbi:Phage-related protein, tail component [Acinetobacter baumannii]|uniref:TipJ family phage tail tip protein n=2 Tax=Acinetobacter baumannii TaxID=470 RepID=UPI000DE626F8|nr:phage tail protein [Acinetobacter baumannii]SSO83845.1 Phage-related protein, tail component [Acinetobacter baumannii]SST51638.1 Phage-related protein, tail component [Acinetobacter baumannii]SST92684.1 Phage-related protein, tail component [Acinetobacter baumannii]SST96238.1 Phage-related protein, tail component [Acinetobacter baumannii]SSU17212.1 Phage-related protein, tail component [Acinetobacter baumannii]